jgi:ribonucleoside-diphosphate reductase alpha chain
VKVTDEFMKAVEEGGKFVQKYTIQSDNPSIVKEIDARDLWEKIVHNAWKSAEPGVLFWDTVEREAIPDNYSRAGTQIIEDLKQKYNGGLEGLTEEDEKILGSARNLSSFKTVSTNPCGEIPLNPYDSCRLLAINLYSYVENPFTEEAEFNWGKFREHVGIAQRLNDDIIDLELEKIDVIDAKIDSDPEPDHIKAIERNLWKQIRGTALDGRRTGTGITGEGDMLAAMGLTYGTKEATDFGAEVQKTLAIEAYRSSVDMAKTRGAFPIYDSEIEKGNPFLERLLKDEPELREEMNEYGRRNISLLTIAPTGTTSMMTQTTSGIEPAFLPIYRRKRKVSQNDQDADYDEIDDEGVSWQHFNVFHHHFKTWLSTNGYDVEEIEQLANESINNKEKQTKLEEIVKKSPYYKATTNDVDYMEKVRMQGRIQKWIDHSISVTINVPKNTKEELIGDLYLNAWKSGCKGITVYRDGSRKGILTSRKENNKKFPSERPEELEADLLRFKNNDENGGEDWIAFIGKINDEPFEIFTGRSEGAMLYIPPTINKGKIKKIVGEKESRYDFIFSNEAGFDNVVGGISHQFRREYWNLARLVSAHLREGTPISNLVKIVSKLDDGTEGINTWKSGIERALRKYIPDGTDSGNICPECDNPIIFQNGCETCSCGEKCG